MEFSAADCVHAISWTITHETRSACWLSNSLGQWESSQVSGSANTSAARLSWRGTIPLIFLHSIIELACSDSSEHVNELTWHVGWTWVLHLRCVICDIWSNSISLSLSLPPSRALGLCCIYLYQTQKRFKWLNKTVSSPCHWFKSRKFESYILFDVSYPMMHIVLYHMICKTYWMTICYFDTIVWYI